MEDSEAEDSEDEFYKQAKQNRAAKLAAKAEIHSRFITLYCTVVNYYFFSCVPNISLHFLFFGSKY